MSNIYLKRKVGGSALVFFLIILGFILNGQVGAVYKRILNVLVDMVVTAWCIGVVDELGLLRVCYLTV